MVQSPSGWFSSVRASAAASKATSICGPGKACANVEAAVAAAHKSEKKLSVRYLDVQRCSQRTRRSEWEGRGRASRAAAAAAATTLAQRRSSRPFESRRETETGASEPAACDRTTVA